MEGRVSICSHNEYISVTASHLGRGRSPHCDPSPLSGGADCAVHGGALHSPPHNYRGPHVPPLDGVLQEDLQGAHCS